MSTLNQKEDNEIRKMIYSFDVEGIEKKILKYRIGKYLCLILFLVVLGYFVVLKVNEGYPIDAIAIAIPLLVGVAFWWKERDLTKAREILLESDTTGRQNQSAQVNPCNPPENPRIT